ncbi:fasciclin domain-containing protein [Pedobacter caeni]|uniref:Fasciclin domain-containing protein n=1 Tax=Pedobacter caeni TaxID=288992 RepID=A0A1M5BXX9_9SPHI|nr:fasciclin domain-containing protein [Pedobacter caeni]SHF47230.1 Fasciclin domain-containing protein [Pedobacter caeni]
MKTKTLLSHVRIFFSFLIAAIVLGSCAKKEFMPPAQGEEIPLTPVKTSTMAEILATPDYSVYKILWQKADMDQYLTTHKTATYTILLLDNNTLNQAGITAANAANLQDTLAKKIIRYHALRNAVDFNVVKQTSGSTNQNTFLTDLIYNRGDYLYPLTISYANSGFLIDGQTAELGEQITLTNNNIAIPLKHLLTVPADMWGMVSKDPRFTIFLDYLRWRDQRYKEIFFEATGIHLTQANDYILKLKNTEFDPDQPLSQLRVMRYTMLMPTNDAFKKLGFNTADDLIAFNKSRTEPKVDPESWSFSGDFTVDSLLSYHLLWPTGRGYKDGLEQKVLQFQPIYSYMMTNQFFGPLNNLPEFNFDFPQGNNSPPKIGIKGSAYPRANFIEKDIRTMNGPLHVLDAILVPENFKLK